MEQHRKSRSNPTHLRVNESMTKEARIHNGEKTSPSTSGAEKTGQLGLRE